MRLHPVTQLMLLAAVLMFGGVLAFAIVFGKAMSASDPTTPPMITVAIWTGVIAPYMSLLVYALVTLASAFWIEALARILAELKRRNALLTER